MTDIISQRIKPTRFINCCNFLLAFAVITILWGAYVRISGSGDGCGIHWPLCHGSFFPFSDPVATLVQTWIEFFHRVKSGLFMVGVTLLCAYTFLLFPNKHSARTCSVLLFLFTIVEALLGAALVLFRLVGTNDSLLRLFVMSLHLVNTLLLVASIVALKEAATHGVVTFPQKIRPYIPGACLILIAITGSWASLSSTLRPSASLLQGLNQDFDITTPLIHKLRIIHPLLTVALVVTALWSVQTMKDAFSKKNKYAVWEYLLCYQICFGILMLLLLSPVWMKIIHLLNGELVWIFYQIWFWNQGILVEQKEEG